MVGSAIHNLLKVKGYENILLALRKDLDLKNFFRKLKNGSNQIN